MGERDHSTGRSKGRRKERWAAKRTTHWHNSELYNGSPAGLREWKQRVQREHKGEKLAGCLLYAVNTSRPRMVRLPVHVDYDNPLDASGWVADVSTGHWFPRGSKYTKVDMLPGYSFRLKNGYTIVTSLDQEAAPQNKCVLAQFGVAVRGNVLVIRHARRIPLLVTSMHASEGQFVDAIVNRFVTGMVTGSGGPGRGAKSKALFGHAE